MEYFSTQEFHRLVSTSVFVICSSIPTLLMAFWGWRYGRKETASYTGFLGRNLVAATLGAWALMIIGGHGILIFPVPSLFCGAVRELSNGNTYLCFPAWWLTPVASILVFTAFVFMGSLQIYKKARNRRW